MNTKELKVEMLRHDDTIETLANFLRLSRATVQRKISGESDFKQWEMTLIKERYNLTTERFVEIFYGEGAKTK